MKYAVIAARVLLGALFVFSGANILLQFMKMPPMPAGDDATWSLIMMGHKYMTFVGVVQLVGGLLVLVGRFVPLGLTLLAPVIVNIWLFHITLQGGNGLAAGAFSAVLELFLLAIYRNSFKGIFAADPLVKPSL